MLAFLAAAILAPNPSPATTEPVAEAPATESAVADPQLLDPATPWWEKITVTVDDKGTQQGCRYETSIAGSADCDPAMADSLKGSGKGKGTQGLFKKVTFERRFSPGGQLDSGKLQPGDMLLGRHVMFLTIDPTGAIASCKVVATSGEAPPNYDCDEVKREQFRAEASVEGRARQAFLTVLSYGHTETIA